MRVAGEIVFVVEGESGGTMRAAMLRGGKVAAGTVADPIPSEGQILVSSLACGICASDLHFMDHPEAGVDDDSGMSTYDQDVDIVMGHEYCAEVIEYGPGHRAALSHRHAGEFVADPEHRRRAQDHWPEPRLARRVR